MCGIAGLVVASGEPWRADVAVARAMARALAHRGPDGEGAWAGAFPGFAAALGHRRLAVIDTSEAAAEPLPSEDARVQLVFNGEVYNHRPLRAGLEAAGHCFRSRTDAEAIVHLYEDRGPACCADLRGMFAFAIADVARGRLLLARDAAGKKPLYYALLEADGRVRALLFGSEPAALFAAEEAGGPPVARDPDREALEDFLAVGYVPAPRTAFRAVRKLAPGTMLLIEDGRARLERYARFADPEPAGGPEAPPEGLRAAVVRAVRARLESDVPLGAFLSGGVDSTIVAAILAREAGRRVATFSIGFEDPRWDESAYARLAARRIGTEHHERTLGEAAFAALPEVVFRHGEPFADESALAVHHLARLARGHVTVALTGDGGDELFLGYRHHRAARALAALDRAAPRWARRALARLAPGILHGGPFGAGRRSAAPEKSLRRQAARLLGALGGDEAERYLAWAGIFPERGGAIAARVREFADGRVRPENVGRRSSPGAESGAIERYDIDVYLPDDLLAKVDRGTMAHGLEARSPFLDEDLARLAARIPARRKSRVPWRGKKVLVDAFRDVLPPEVVARPKMGFGVPVGIWLRGGLRGLAREVLLSERALARGVLAPAAVRAILDDHEARRAENGRKIYALLALEAWFRAYVDPPRPALAGF
jgi:asparagine synthase (glutamine-hydrolysing)